MVPLYRSFLSLERIMVSLRRSFLSHWERIKVPLLRSFLSLWERIKVRGK